MIKKIKIRGFLQQFNYDLDFEGADIKFITGPNGYGKSTILNLVDYLFHEQWKELCAIVFNSVEIILSDERIRIEKEKISENNDDEDSDDIRTTYRMIVSYNDRPCVYVTGAFDENGIVVGKVKVEKKEAYKTDFKLFINSQKLISIKDSRLYKNPKALKDNLLVIEENSKALRSLLLEKRDDVRIILAQNDEDSLSSEESYSEDKKEFWNMLKKYKLVKKEEGICSEEKLDMIFGKLNSFIKKLDLFSSIIEQCEFTHKKMTIDPELGYIFNLDDEYQSILDFPQLSSGEKQILTILYTLLFDVEEDSIILIDEPEISFHMSWQVMFFSVLKQILKNKHAQYIIATHSPQMFELDFDNAIDLYEISEERA